MQRISSQLLTPFSKWQFWKDLLNEIDEDQVFNSAASLSYYFLLAIFPALIFMMTLLPYLPIEHLTGALMTLISQLLPETAAKALETTVIDITTTKKQGLLSFGILFTIWSASSGLYAIMQSLNTTYDVRETRPFWKVRGLSIALTVVFGVAVIGSFILIVTGGLVQNWLDQTYVLNSAVPILFQAFRWLVILTLLMGGFAILYYFGTNVDQKFRFITPGAIIAVVGLVVASLLFRVYVTNFSDYSASYGSLGAVVVLMLWFYIAGSMILIGSEINALLEGSPTKKESIAKNAAFKLKTPPEKPSRSERKEATTTAAPVRAHP